MAPTLNCNVFVSIYSHKNQLNTSTTSLPGRKLTNPENRLKGRGGQLCNLEQQEIFPART